MTTFVFANFFQTTIAASATSAATSIQVASDANVPTIAAGQQWAIVVQSANTPSIREVMYVTATSGTTFTVSRGQEGTAAQAWAVGDNVMGANTSGQMADFVQSPHMADGSISPTFGEIHGTGIDGTPIGATAPSTGAFTALTALGPLSPNGFANMQVFTSSGTFTVPDGVTMVHVTAVAGGGSGGGSAAGAATPPYAGTGGGAGGTAIGVESVTPGQQIAVTVGVGGAAPPAQVGGNAGGNSSFGGLIGANGGGGGQYLAATANAQEVAGGAGVNGAINIQGGGGACVIANAALSGGALGGSGGSSALGGAGGVYSPGGASNGQFPGGGGGGGGGFGDAGGAGAPGVVIVRW